MYIFLGNNELNKEQVTKVQQFPLSSHGLFMGKYLEQAVDAYIYLNYHENEMPMNHKEINYLAFFGTSEEIKELLLEECKLINRVYVLI